MTKTVNIADAKARLSRLVDRVMTGEEIVLSKAGRPVARIVPLAERSPREPGVRRNWDVPDDLFVSSADDVAEPEATGRVSVRRPR